MKSLKQYLLVIVFYKRHLTLLYLNILIISVCLSKSSKKITLTVLFDHYRVHRFSIPARYLSVDR